MGDKMDIVVKYFLPIFIGGFIGWFTNYLAIKMLFRPYNKIKILGINLPFTPGLIPKEKGRIAESLSSTISNEFLNKEILLKYLTSDEMKERINEITEEAILWVKKNQNTFYVVLERYFDNITLNNNIKVVSQNVSKEIVKKIKEYDLSKKIANKVVVNLLSDNESIIGKTISFFINDKMSSSVEKIIKEKIDEYIDLNGEQEINNFIFNEINLGLNKPISAYYEEYENIVIKIKKHIVKMYEMLINNSVDKILLVIDFKRIINERINELDVEELEKIILDISKKELNAITYIGGLLGIIIGAINIFI